MPGAPSTETIQQLKDLHKRGLFLDAWDLIKDLDPPEQWPESGPRLRGAWLIERLGAAERARRMVLREWRRRETRYQAREDVFWEVLRTRGALLTWQWLEKHPPDPREVQQNHWDHHGFQGYLLTKLRDYERAEAALAEGLRLDPQSRWLRVLQVDLLEAQDRRAEALAAVEAVLEIEPGYISAIGCHAEILADMGKDEDAVATLRKGLTLVQSGPLAAQLAGLLIELDRVSEAEAALDLYEKFSPLCEGAAKEWLLGRRCDLASRRGDQSAALNWAAQIEKDGFYQNVARKLGLAQGDSLRRKVLSVPFVRQNDVTCAPATVTSLAQYWGHDVEHLELAEEICYDGTPDYRERNWAEKNGWVTKEFRVTVEAAKQLIDAEMPFVLNTVFPGGAHAQAVMGYDEFRTVLFIRDPGHRHMTEFLAEEALKEQAPFGPRGFVMVPAPEAERLAALRPPLPDAEVYEFTHQISSALAAHDRLAAAAALETLRRDWPNHLLRWHGELSLARYDGNYSQVLRCLEELQSLHPDVVNWQTETMNMIREVRGREAMLSALREICAKKNSHPLLWRMLARELQSDDRNNAEVQRLLNRVHRHRLDALAIVAQANQLWTRREWPKATQLYRLASCLEPRNEGIAMSYFNAAIWTRETEAALAMLRRRYEREGDLSGQPATTLARALEQVNRSVESLAVLEESLQRRPDDADHALYVAGELAVWGRLDEARAILERTPKNARAAAWHRVQARLAMKEGDSARQLQHRRAIVADQPLDVTAHRSIAALLEQQEGAQAAITHLRSVCERFPFHWSLHTTLLDWLRQEGPEAWEKGTRDLLRIDPGDAWAHRDLADALRAAKRYAEAHAELDVAAALEPGSAALHSVRASIYEDEEKPLEARAACRRALALDIDSAFALRLLIRACRTQEERLAELRFIQEELKRQATNGEGVLEFAAVARRYLDAQELLIFLREGRAARPDLWQTGVTLMEQLRHVDLKQESTDMARSLTEAFPLMPRVWLELGLSLDAQGLRAEAITALQKVREMNPDWTYGMEKLYSLLRKAGDYAGARAVLEQALRHNPQNHTLLGCLADLLWLAGEKAAAVEHLKKAVDSEPGYSWAWEKLPIWGAAAGQPEAAKEAIKRLLRERPAEARSWMILADSLDDSSELEERLAALDKAIDCSPESWGPVDEKARVLALAGRFEEALKISQNHSSRAAPLGVRAAWILGYKGEYEPAVKAMEAVLADDPGQTWGWQLLVDWHQEHDQLDRAEKALENLIRLQPDNCTHLGYLADLQLKRLKKNEAKLTLERALQVAPDYRFAIQKLFWMHIEALNYKNALDVINAARPHLTNIEYLSRLFTLSCRRQEWGEAWKHLAAILQDPEEDEQAFERLYEEVKRLPKHMLKPAEERLIAALRSEQPNAGTGRLYVQVCEVAGKLPKPSVLALAPERSEISRRMHVRYLNYLAWSWMENHKKLEGLIGIRERWRLKRVMKRHDAWLREETHLYGAVSYVLYSMHLTRETIAWMSDWRERTDLKPYMVDNLVLALQERGLKQEAEAVIARGMTLADHNGDKMRFHIWAAIEHALSRQEAAARACLDAVNRAELDGYATKLLDFAELLLLYQPNPRARNPFSEKARLGLRSFREEHPRNPLMRDAVRRACLLMAEHTQSLKPRLWYLWENWRASVLSALAFSFAYVLFLSKKEG